MRRPHLFILAIGHMLCDVACAQTATIQVVHDDSDGILDPGQVVRISAMLNWSPIGHNLFGGTGGSLLASPALGQSEALSTQYSPGLTTFGSPVPGGIVGGS